MTRVDPTMTSRARALRANATLAERTIWRRLSQHRPRFTRQFVVGPFIVDLACRSVKLAVELDGSQHLGSIGDEHRTRFLEAEGWTVLRFWNAEVASNPDGVADAIILEAERLARGQGRATHP